MTIHSLPVLHLLCQMFDERPDDPLMPFETGMDAIPQQQIEIGGLTKQGPEITSGSRCLRTASAMRATASSFKYNISR